MNPLRFFWENGFEGQTDIFEGVSSVVAIEEFGPQLPDAVANGLVRDIRLQPVGYGSCNVFCMSRVDVALLGQNALLAGPNGMGGFGGEAVVVTDVQEFVRRVDAAIRRLGFWYRCGSVSYHVPTAHGEPARVDSHVTFKTMEPVTLERIGLPRIMTHLDAFDKRSVYGGQREWRICLCRGGSEPESYVLDVGDLRDVTLHTDAERLLDKGYLARLALQYGSVDLGGLGNVTREGLRERLVSAGSDRYYVIFDL